MSPTTKGTPSRTTAQRRAALYVRQSLDRTGEALAVTRQEELCRATARERGWLVIEVYRDNSVSASNAKKKRPEYERMLRDLQARKVDAVVVYDLDRLTRQPIELEQFMVLADEYGVALASVDRDVDLSTDNGRMFARMKGIIARHEVERKADRQRRSNDQRASKGLPHRSWRKFGYEDDAMTIREDEAEVIREVANRLLAGESRRSVALDLNERGIRRPGGGTWDVTILKRTLVNPRYAALRVHRGEVVGDGAWPAILDVDTFKALEAVLNDPTRVRPGPQTRYMLSSLAKCGVCGQRIGAARQTGKGRYWCITRNHVLRLSEPVDELVDAVMVGRLSRPDAHELFARQSDRSEIEKLRAEEKAVRARLDGLAMAFADGSIDAGQLRAGSERLRERLADLGRQMDSTARTTDVSGLLGAADVALAWSALDLDRKRAVLDAFVTITLDPPGPGRKAFDPTKIRFDWKS